MKMKKSLLSLVIVLSSYSSYAQNTFPSSGSVGIGTPTPNSKLTVIPNIGNFSQQFNISGAAPNGAVDEILLGFNSYGGSGPAPLKVDATKSAWTITPRTSATDIYSALYVNYSTVAGVNYTPLVILGGSTAANSNILLAASGGKVGIGTTSPIVALDIAGYNTSNSQLRAGSFEVQPYAINNSILYDNARYNGSVNIYRNTGYASAIQFVNGSITFNTAPSGTAETVASLTPKMYISNTGYVGIGTTTPDEALIVYGKIHAREVKIEWNIPYPDYVFKPTYKLPKLTELKTYIDKNHRLPEMPTEAEVAKNGLNLGETNVLLTKKVEELTLYAIDQQKQITEQQKVNQSLQQQIDQLAKKLNN
jgi:hypothetical protein